MISDAPKRFPLALVGLLTAAAFGPYVSGSVRTEQLAVYGTAALLVPLTFFHARPYWPLIAPWFGILLVSLLGLVPPAAYTPAYEAGTLLSGLDNLTLPLIVMMLVWSVVPRSSATSALSVVAAIIVWITAANGLLSMVGTQVDLSAFLRPFWSGDIGETTAERAAQMGRLSGIFNQPAEAGVVYGVAGILAVWRYRNKPKTTLMLLALISIGGMLCVSKVFILGGIPLILIHLWKSRAGFGNVGLLFGAALVAAGVAQSGFFQEWTGFNYLARLVAPDQDQGLIEFYSAGRWNEEAGMMAVFDVVVDASPVFGFGLAGIQMPYDSAWTEVMVLDGLLGAVLLCIVYWAIFRMARRLLEPDLRLMATFLALFLAGASLGIPSLTVNRASTIVWVVLALLCMVAMRPRAARTSRTDATGLPILTTREVSH
ncbi:hypothetical protein ACFC25_01840 [Pseudarthrobacter sp. NPDC055928]|uniref:hypothetical protein n=1 Tax=Pseudarthrobacter sp. NPDC055928 TaxID=3345661 RepID=UPI0035DEC303